LTQNSTPDADYPLPFANGTMHVEVWGRVIFFKINNAF